LEEHIKTIETSSQTFQPFLIEATIEFHTNMLSQVNFEEEFLTQMIIETAFAGKAANHISRLSFSIKSV
jgi:hypothetical protein